MGLITRFYGIQIWFNIKIAIKISNSKYESTQVIYEETKRLSEIDTTEEQEEEELKKRKQIRSTTQRLWRFWSSWKRFRRS